MYQPPLPQKYQELTDIQADQIISAVKDRLAERMVILGHHYQRDNVVKHAHYAGDSLELSKIAVQQQKAEFIVFCGVHFMAESADILTAEHQKVLLPDLTAGCSMADMAEIDQVKTCWGALKSQMDQPNNLVPATYVNSTATIKAFCGQNNGICVTSSNCRPIFEHIWDHNPQALILFLPDQHLGRNTAFDMGVPLEQMPLWDPCQPNGGLNPSQITHARVILWKGFCSVHQEFTTQQIEKARKDDPAVNVIVHPECPFEVAQKADYTGSTALIIKTITNAPASSAWAVGTEINLVNRLAEKMKNQNIKVRPLSNTDCLCETMYRIDPRHLAWMLDSLAAHLNNPNENPLPNVITVPDNIKQPARLALQRMIDVTSAAEK